MRQVIKLNWGNWLHTHGPIKQTVEETDMRRGEDAD